MAKYNSSKLGPFDVLFCVGKFLDEKNEITLSRGWGKRQGSHV